MTCLICGSLAYDTIMSFHGRFADALLPEQLHKVNVAFLVPDMRREYGGVAGNIAYNLKLLGGDLRIMATIGEDGRPYLDRLEKLNISARNIRVIRDVFTAQGFITTDVDNNQITAFHPGAMGYSHENKIADASKGVKLAIVAPDGREGMLQNARDCARLNIPFIFDPGQGLPMFDGKELREFIEQATYIATNDYEASLLTERTGWTRNEIAERVKAFIVTKGEHGSQIYSEGKIIDVPGVPAKKAVDPTGCGDAYRAGLMHGMTSGFDWETSGRLGSLMGSLKIAHQGAQSHFFSKQEIADKFYEAFKYRF